MGSLTFESVTYKTALKNVSLGVDAGETAAVRVPRKTDRDALLRIAASMLGPDSGLVRVEGRLVFAQRYWSLMGGPDVLDQLALPLLALGYTVIRSREIALEALVQWGLEDWSGRELGELEEHELAQLSLIRAVVSKPDVLLVDNPTAGFAGLLTEPVKALLKMAAAQGAAVLVATSEIDPMVGVRSLYSLTLGELRGNRPEPADVVELPRAIV